jgi:hypothetical protein
LGDVRAGGDVALWFVPCAGLDAYASVWSACRAIEGDDEAAECAVLFAGLLQFFSDVGSDLYEESLARVGVVAG